MHKHILASLSLLIACQTEDIDSVDLELNSEEIGPNDVLTGEDPVTATGERVGGEIDPSRRPAGLQADGTTNLDLVPEWIPVGAWGEVVGYAKKSDVYGIPATPEDALQAAQIPIYDEDEEVIGRFIDGLPAIGEEFMIKQNESEGLREDVFPLTQGGHVAAWPVPVSYMMYLQNYYPAVGAVGECARHVSGSYGSVFFTNSEAKSSWGGICNANNSRPPGWLLSRSRAFSGGVLTWDSGTVGNPAWASVQQTTVPKLGGQTLWCGTSSYYKSGSGTFQSYNLCAS